MARKYSRKTKPASKSKKIRGKKPQSKKGFTKRQIHRFIHELRNANVRQEE